VCGDLRLLYCHFNTTLDRASSISTRPRRGTYSHETEPWRIRSCLRGPNRDHGSVVPPTLTPLAEDSTPSPAAGESNPSAVLGAAIPSMAIADMPCALPPHTLSHSETSISHPTSPSTLSPIPLSKAISPASYFTRRRDAYISSTSIASTSSPSRDPAITTSPPHSPTLAKASSFSDLTPNSSQPYPTASPQTPAERPILHTIPLQPCCKACIATLEACPSSLLPIASEAANAHWTPRARAKKVADEKEEAVRAAASETAKANMDYIMRLWGDKPSSYLQNNRDSEVQGLEVATVGLRSPLTPQSLRRNRELRESFNIELEASIRDQLAAETGSKTRNIEGKGRSVGRCGEGDQSSPDEDLKDRADLGVHAVRRHSQLVSRPEDLFDKEEGEEVDEMVEDAIDGDTEPDDEEQREGVPIVVNRKDGREVGVGAPMAAPAPRSSPVERTPPPRTPSAGKGFSSLDTYLSSTKPAKMTSPPSQSLESTQSSQVLTPSSNKSTFRRPGIARSASEGGVAPPTSFKVFSSPQSGGNGSGSGFMNILRRRASKDTLPSSTPSTSSTRMKTASTGAGTLNILSSLGRLPGVGA